DVVGQDVDLIAAAAGTTATAAGIGIDDVVSGKVITDELAKRARVVTGPPVQVVGGRGVGRSDALEVEARDHLAVGLATFQAEGQIPGNGARVRVIVPVSGRGVEGVVPAGVVVPAHDVAGGAGGPKSNSLAAFSSS